MVKSSVIVMDLDGTICFPNLEYEDSKQRYAQAIPNVYVIHQMQRLSEEGWKFVILTARRMITHNGDIEAVKEDVGDLTENWLKKHEVPYEYIQWGKPYAAFYVDDKAMTIEEFLNYEK